MNIRVYKEFPPQAMLLRTAVFVEEQGFVDEFDANDAIATHFVAYNEIGEPVATCRVFPVNAVGMYTLGRFCVKRECRGQHIGCALLEAAERHVISQGGRQMVLHSQLHAKGFYEKCGYIVDGGIEYEQNHPHIFMFKELI